VSTIWPENARPPEPPGYILNMQYPLASIAAMVFLAAHAAPRSARAALCDDSYTLQSATETWSVGTDPDKMVRIIRPLRTDFSDLSSIHPLMAYEFLTGFDGSCVKAARPVRFMGRAAGAGAFTAKIDNGYQVVMHDSNTVLENTRFGYWFGFYKPADSLKLMVGRIRDQGPDFRAWYGYVTFEDSVRNPESGLWTAKGTQLRMAGPSDSAVLDSLLMKRSGYRDLVFDGNRRGHFRLQFIGLRLVNNSGIAIRQRALPADRRSGADAKLKERKFLADGSEAEAEKIPSPAAPNGTRRYIVGNGR
jgi:hypothetical protein